MIVNCPPGISRLSFQKIQPCFSLPILIMTTSIFISLPVKEVKKSLSFYESLGFKANPQFTGDDTASVAVSDTISVMLASHEQFKRISPRPIADATKGCQV